MKQTFYKIIAIASVLLGALGPQVASGSVQVMSKQVLPQPVTSNYSLDLSQEPTSQVSVQIQFQQEQQCWMATDGSRLDLMLWTGCNSLAIAPSLQQSLPSLAVVSQPEQLPAVIVQDSVSLTAQASFDSGSSRENSVIPSLGFNFKVSTTEVVANATVNRLSLTEAPLFNSSNNLRTIVMRC